MGRMRFARPLLGTSTLRPSTVRPGNARPPMAARVRPPVDGDTPPDPIARDAKLAAVEAALFLADEPLTARKLADAAGLADAAVARHLVDALRARYDADGTAFQVEELAGGYQLLTRREYHSWLLRMRRIGPDLRLSPSAMETLAVIAYRQPITRADIESVRGVQCGDVIRVLMERGLIRNAGRHQSLGRPQLYATTKKFLQAFGLNSVGDLPPFDVNSPTDTQ